MHLIKLNMYFWFLLKDELDFLDMISFPNDETFEVFQLRSGKKTIQGFFRESCAVVNTKLIYSNSI